MNGVRERAFALYAAGDSLETVARALGADARHVVEWAAAGRWRERASLARAKAAATDEAADRAADAAFRATADAVRGLAVKAATSGKDNPALTSDQVLALARATAAAQAIRNRARR